MSRLPSVFYWQNMQVRSIQPSALSSQPDRSRQPICFRGSRLSSQCT